MLRELLDGGWKSTLRRDGGRHPVKCECEECDAWLEFSVACDGLAHQHLRESPSVNAAAKALLLRLWAMEGTEDW